jgi:hypothetical protein
VNNGTAARPAPPHEAPDGCHWVAVVETDPAWGVAGQGRTCRRRMPGGRAHGVPAVVRKTTGITRRVPWNFCLEHGEGHWVQDGRVYHWAPRRNDREKP